MGIQCITYDVPQLAIWGFIAEYQMVLKARQLSADQSVETDSLFRGFDGQGAVDLRRNPDNKFSAAWSLGQRSGWGFSVSLHVLNSFFYGSANSF